MTKHPSVKILVGYHKPAYLLKSDVLVPIHLGRALATEASKDGAMSQEEYQWMLSNMIGDDTGDNISKLNRHFAELTAIYWAWKNYDKLGNPDYIGFCHYRRYLDFSNTTPLKEIHNGVAEVECLSEDFVQKHGLYAESLEKELQGCDIIHGSLINYRDNVMKQFDELEAPQFGLKSETFHSILNYIAENCPQYQAALNIYLSSKKHYWYNCFVMKKEIFMEYCNFIFPVLLKFQSELDYSQFTLNGQRILGYIAERLMGIFITKKLNEQALICYKPLIFIQNTSLILQIEPAFKHKNVPVILSSDNNYAPYLATCIKSIIENSSAENNYDLFVLEENISERNKNLIKQMQCENVSIRFVDVKPFLSRVDVNIFHLCAHFSLATYYRFFIPRFFNKFKKVIYLDCDTVVLDDIAKFYQIDLAGKCIGAIRDLEMARAVYMENYYHSSWQEYLQKTLQLSSPENYFQAGVLIFDISKLTEMDFECKCLNFLSQVTPRYVDQCIMNHVLENNVKFLDYAWNVEWMLPLYTKVEQQLPLALYNFYKVSYTNPKIIHYCGRDKPWKNPTLPLAEYFWKYARQTTFYEEILYQNLSVTNTVSGNNIVKDVVNYNKNRLGYWKYKILSKVTWGKKRI